MEEDNHFVAHPEGGITTASQVEAEKAKVDTTEPVTAQPTTEPTVEPPATEEPAAGEKEPEATAGEDEKTED